ncbi:MAG: hypothetical protein M1833_003515 [Piccolia ochrophora]|nr:MAG: hypothetical protein M1833_003515 [Piccolia ochrophora]
MGRFVMYLQENARSDSGVMPSKAQLEAMGAYNKELMDAKAFVVGEGLMPTSRGARVYFPANADEADEPPAPKDKLTVTRGPFDVTKERCMAGFWVINAKDLDEALHWAKKAPFAGIDLEVRQIFDMDESCGASADAGGKPIEEESKDKQ